MQLELTPDAAQVLQDVLDHALGDTREEIYKAEVADYKALLRKRETIIQSLLDRLKAPTS